MIIEQISDTGEIRKINFIEDENIILEECEGCYCFYTSHTLNKKYLNLCVLKNQDHYCHNYDPGKEECYNCESDECELIIVETNAHDSVYYCEECFNGQFQHYKVSDYEIILLHGYYKELTMEAYENGKTLSIPYSYEMAERILKVDNWASYGSLERLSSYDCIEFGTTLRGGWLINEGENIYKFIKQFWNHSKEYGRVDNDDKMTVFEMTLNRNLTADEKQELFKINKIINVKV